MSYKPDKKPASPKPRRKPRRPPAEVRSDKMTAAHIVATLHQTQEDLADLLYEFRYMGRYSELDDMAWVIYRLDVLRQSCQRFADTGSWED